MGTYNHTGHVVTDLERSKQFYQEVFGFKLWYEITPPDEPTAKLTSLTPPLGVTASYLTLDGFVLELMHYSAPGATASFRPRTMNEPGLTHLSISSTGGRSSRRVTSARHCSSGTPTASCSSCCRSPTGEASRPSRNSGKQGWLRCAPVAVPPPAAMLGIGGQWMRRQLN
jgi:hypothetical protein